MEENGRSSRTTARLLDITGHQAEAAGAYELSLNLPRPIAGGPWSKWHFTIPGNPQDARTKLAEPNEEERPRPPAARGRREKRASRPARNHRPPPQPVSP